MILVDTRWYSGLYDFDGKTLSKVLRIYNSDNTFYYERLKYAYDEEYKEYYREATERDIELYKYKYYDDEGNLVIG